MGEGRVAESLEYDIKYDKSPYPYAGKGDSIRYIVCVTPLYQIFLNAILVLCPPNPKVLDIAALTTLSCALLKVKFKL